MALTRGMVVDFVDVYRAYSGTDTWNGCRCVQGVQWHRHVEWLSVCTGRAVALTRGMVVGVYTTYNGTDTLNGCRCVQGVQWH